MSGSKPFNTLIVLLKEFCEKVNFEKSQRRTIKAGKLPNIQRVNSFSALQSLCCSYTFTNRFANIWRIWYRFERHDNATAAKAYVAIMLHDHLIGDRVV